MQCDAMQCRRARHVDWRRGACRGVGFLDWERNGRTVRETVVSRQY
jgi:hypothetical protein